jgi:hypothetical protein
MILQTVTARDAQIRGSAPPRLPRLVCNLCFGISTEANE